MDVLSFDRGVVGFSGSAVVSVNVVAQSVFGWVTERMSVKMGSKQTHNSFGDRCFLQLPHHVCGTRCQYSYGIVTVLDNLNGC